MFIPSHAAMTLGRVYRTREIRGFSANPSRWAKRLVEQGVLRQPHHGLFCPPRVGRFGPAPPIEEACASIRAWVAGTLRRARLDVHDD